jgi:hypothetical protein
MGEGKGIRKTPFSPPPPSPSKAYTKKFHSKKGGNIFLSLLLTLASYLLFNSLLAQIPMSNGMVELTISSINCNSLNMSNSAKWNQSIKIYGIAKLRTDIIFLSDIRLSNKNVSFSRYLKTLFEQPLREI